MKFTCQVAYLYLYQGILTIHRLNLHYLQDQEGCQLQLGQDCSRRLFGTFVPDKQRFLPGHQQSTVLTGNLPEQGTDVKAKTTKKRERN